MQMTNHVRTVTMLDYREIAINSIRNRDDLKGWIDDLTDTGQLLLAEDLTSFKFGMVLSDAALFRLAFYIAHVEGVSRGN